MENGCDYAVGEGDTHLTSLIDVLGAGLRPTDPNPESDRAKPNER